MKTRALSSRRLAPFLQRHMQMASLEADLRLDTFLLVALEKANEFVPSESGSIFLDDPALKWTRRRDESQLSAVACFGPRSRGMLGRKIPANRGIVGRVYLSGNPYYSKDVRCDPHFTGDVDKEINHQTRSVLCVPISIRSSQIGVLELINKRGKRPFTQADFELLKIFADYISASIQNFLDAKRNAEKARRDNLTGLYNDRQFYARLKQETPRIWRSRRDLGLIFLDLDGFKEVNDKHGHLAGSRVLVEVAEVLRLAVRAKRAEIARYGGDEYVVLLPGADGREAAAVAEDIRRAIERTVFLDEASPDVPALHVKGQITASLGVACMKEHVGAKDYGQLISAADEAMYAAKMAGKNRVCIAKPTRRERVALRTPLKGNA